MKLILSVLIAFLFSYGKATCQNRYATVDSLMRSYNGKVKTADDLYKLTYYIRNTFTPDSERVRAAFIWITENIAYDVKAFQKEDPSAAQITYVIKHKKAICSGYAGLLKYFCDGLGIPCEVVDGRVRAGKRDINISQAVYRTNHAWNAVKIGENWRLIDPTWASGGVDDTDEDHLKFVKNYREIYFFTPPDRFILNHFPKLPKYQFLEKGISINQFAKSPLYSSEYVEDSILAIRPDTALIKGRVGDTLKLRFKTLLPDTRIVAWSEYKKAEYLGTAIQKEGWLHFDYPIQASGFYYLYLGYYKPGRVPLLVAYRLEIEPKK